MKRGLFLISLLCKSKYHIVHKAGNLFLIALQEKIFKNSIVKGYPYHLIIDPGNICNLKCPLCPTGQGKGTRNKGMLTLDNYTRIIDRLAPYLLTVDLYNWGEPFLNKNIFKMVRYAYDHGIKVTLSSNLNHFDNDMAEELVNSGCSLLFVSLYGASQESVSKYQIGTDFTKVIDNVRKIKEARKGKPVPLLVWEYGVTKYSEPEIPAARALARDIFDVFWTAPISCDMGDQVLMDQESQYDNVRPLLPANETYSMYSYARKTRKSSRNTCSFLYKQTSINWDGSVSPCCAYYDQQYDFGNMFETDFKIIWNNEKYQSARKAIFRDDESGIKTICHICRRNGAMK